jgi:hypothetical protein
VKKIKINVVETKDGFLVAASDKDIKLIMRVLKSTWGFKKFKLIEKIVKAI